jgi:hypothetical protein
MRGLWSDCRARDEGRGALQSWNRDVWIRRLSFRPRLTLRELGMEIAAFLILISYLPASEIVRVYIRIGRCRRLTSASSQREPIPRLRRWLLFTGQLF